MIKIGKALYHSDTAWMWKKWRVDTKDNEYKLFRTSKTNKQTNAQKHAWLRLKFSRLYIVTQASNIAVKHDSSVGRAFVVIGSILDRYPGCHNDGVQMLSPLP